MKLLSPIAALTLLNACSASPQHDAPYLLGKVWVVEDVNGVGIVDMSRGDMTFSADGQVSGLSFCNSYGGTYEVNGGEITFGPMRMTKKACPAALMDLETKMLDILKGDVTYSFDEFGAVTFTGENGGTLTTLPE